eukprot:3396247-Prymnesium_polylepis.1
MNSTFRLLALVARRHLTLLTADGLADHDVRRSAAACHRERALMPTTTWIRSIACPHHVRQFARPAAGPYGSG